MPESSFSLLFMTLPGKVTHGKKQIPPPEGEMVQMAAGPTELHTNVPWEGPVKSRFDSG